MNNMKNFSEVARLIATLIRISKKMKEYGLLYQLLKVYGQVSEISDELKRAIAAYTIMRDVACESEEPVKIMEAYELLGCVLQRDKQYERSAMCFKKVLFHAWFHNSRKWELLAFENLALQYFYLGEIK